MPILFLFSLSLCLAVDLKSDLDPRKKTYVGFYMGSMGLEKVKLLALGKELTDES